MTFSKQVKDEIIKKNVFKQETRALVQGLVLSSGSLIISKSGLSFVVSVDSENVVEFLRDNFQKLFPGIEIEIVKLVKSFKNKERFELTVSENFNEKVLVNLGIVKCNTSNEVNYSDVADRAFMKNSNSMMAFLTGMFLGSGTISVPREAEGNRSYGYHFEIDLTTKNQADLISEILSNFDVFAKVIQRNEEFVVYLKKSETIFDVLGMMGASKVVLELTSNQVNRDMNNITNRQINCISANIDKAVNAGVKQLEAIDIIRSTVGIESLPEPLQEAALSRLSNPEGTLNELLQTLSTKISKGALAQRFNKIIKIAEELGDDNGK
ncbi:MAG: DNA-binding protein WhiA [Clostridia bacterium]|nr:DNA-binding protein WhiA [Clostridia bacterium]